MGTVLLIALRCVAVAAALGFATFVVRYLRGEPSRGRPRCPRCWYDLSDHPGIAGSGPISGDRSIALQCPECGRQIRRGRELLRPRRRRGRLAAAAVCGAAGLISLAATKAARDGWWSVVPNQVIIYAPTDSVGLARRLTGLDPSSVDVLVNEVGGRLASDSFSAWEERTLAAHMKSGLSRRGLYSVDTETLKLLDRLEEPVSPGSGPFPPRTIPAFAESLSRLLDVPVTVAPGALEDAGLLPSTELGLEINAEAGSLVLDRFVAAIESSGRTPMRWVPSATGVEIVADAGRSLRRWQFFEIADLVRRPRSIRGSNVGAVFSGRSMQGTSVDDLIELVSTTFDPQTWSINGGADASAVGFGGRMLVEADPRILAKVTAFLYLLRDEAFISETPRDALVREFLLQAHEHTVRLGPSYAWGSVCLAFREQAGVALELDPGTPPPPLGSAPEALLPISAALDLVQSLLDKSAASGARPIRWRALSPGRVLFSHRAPAPSPAIYRVDDLPALTAGGDWRTGLEHASQLLDAIESEIDPDEWVIHGGELAWGSVWDPQRPRLVVTATASMHVRIGKYLQSLREKRSEHAERPRG